MANEAGQMVRVLSGAKGVVAAGVVGTLELTFGDNVTCQVLEVAYPDRPRLTRLLVRTPDGYEVDVSAGAVWPG